MKMDPLESNEAHQLIFNCLLDQRCTRKSILVTGVYITTIFNKRMNK